MTRRGRLGAIILLAIAALLPGLGRAQSTYTVEDVTVDVAADDAVAAREQAIARAQADGLRRLFQTLAPEAAPSELPDVASLDVPRHVRSFEIASEQVGARRYVGRLNVTYVGSRVGSLARAGLALAPPARPTLVVPAMVQEDGRLGLWWEAEPWRQALAQAAAADPASKALLPLGDVDDLTALTAEEVAAGNPPGAARLRERYAADRIVLAVLPQGGGPVELRPLAADLAPQTVEVPGGGDPLADAAAATLRAVPTLARPRVPAPVPVQNVRVTVPLGDLATWLRVRRDLEAEPLVKSSRLLRFARDRAELTLGVAGDVAALQQALAARGYGLEPDGEGWRLTAGLAAGGAY